VPLAELPIVDLSEGARAAAGAIDAACRDTGFFYVVGHGVDDELGLRLEALAREFFALDDEEKSQIAMARGGAAWRGWFPVGGELTSGRPDRKEGIYFGAELGPDHPRVQAGVPLHGANLFPARPAGLRAAVLEYLDEMTRVGHALLAAMAVALDLEPDWFEANLTADPTVLFRIFHYPPSDPDDEAWGVGEHTDYGLLTILRQDGTGGLEVKSPSGWIDAPPIPGSFVCNLGDMLERMTGGRYRSTPHRVRNTTGSGRLSFPFFFDPSWDAEIVPTPGAAADPGSRWDGADVHAFQGTYGDYLLAKVARVFPELKGEVLDR
jgi:isopenicillin N synthase-like dioxygenase